MTRAKLALIVRGAAAILVLLAGGCVTPVSMRPAAPAVPFGRDAKLIYLPGIGSIGAVDAKWMRGLRDGGYEGEIETCDWCAGLGSLQALWDHGRQRAEGRRLAARICQLRAKSPASPILLTAHSAGAGVVALALEDLPAGTAVDGVVLMAPALSRDYNLTPALRHVRGHVDVYCSDRDALVLAIGTTLFGTVDGVHGPAAGREGFVRPAAADGRQYDKLNIHPFSRERQLRGDDGGHYGCESPELATLMVAPLLPSGSSAPQFPPIRQGLDCVAVH